MSAGLRPADRQWNVDRKHARNHEKKGGMHSGLVWRVQQIGAQISLKTCWSETCWRRMTEHLKGSLKKYMFLLTVCHDSTVTSLLVFNLLAEDLTQHDLETKEDPGAQASNGLADVSALGRRLAEGGCPKMRLNCQTGGF